jgi:hypothetical protein
VGDTLLLEELADDFGLGIGAGEPDQGRARVQAAQQRGNAGRAP